MASTTAHLKWKRSPSVDAKANVVKLFLDGEQFDEITVGPGIESLDVPDVEEGRLFKAVVVVSDGTNFSAEVAVEKPVPDVTAPEPVSELDVTFG